MKVIFVSCHNINELKDYLIRKLINDGESYVSIDNELHFKDFVLFFKDSKINEVTCYTEEELLNIFTEYKKEIFPEVIAKGNTKLDNFLKTPIKTQSKKEQLKSNQCKVKMKLKYGTDILR